jgi:hypothetical protein
MLVENEIERWLTLLKQRQFSCRISLVIAMWGVDFGDRDHQTVLTQPDLFLWGFLVERACGHDPRSVEEFKHKNEQVVSGTEQ